MEGCCRCCRELGGGDRKDGRPKPGGGALLMISPPAVGLVWSWRSERRGGGLGEEGRNSGRGNKMGFEILLMEGK